MQAAIFNELSSTPATVEASKAVEAYGLMPGNAIGHCDAEQAYVQSELGGTTTWVSLPKERWPESFKAFRRPACPACVPCTVTRMLVGVGKRIVRQSCSPAVSLQLTTGRASTGNRD
eukprot:14607070-Heterocapsa_arctica.AAC.1